MTSIFSPWFSFSFSFMMRILVVGGTEQEVCNNNNIELIAGVIMEYCLKCQNENAQASQNKTRSNMTKHGMQDTISCGAYRIYLPLHVVDIFKLMPLL